MNADGKMSLAKPTFDKKTDGATTRIQIRAGTKEEALHILKGVREKYPQLRHRKVDEIYSAFQEKSHYDPSPLRIELDFGGVDCGRSIVKSAVALVFEAGIRPEQCNIALSYLLSDGEEPCFGYYYTKDKDIILNRPPQTPIHCVYVEGRSEESSIVGYIELFSLWRIVFCLSDTYKGSDFTHAYAVDPIKGEELDVSVNLDLSLSEIHEAYEYEHLDYEVYKDVICQVLDKIQTLDFNRAMRQAIENAIDAACIKSGIKEGDVLSEDQIGVLAKDVAEGMVPFITHNISPRPSLEELVHQDC